MAQLICPVDEIAGDYQIEDSSECLKLMASKHTEFQAFQALLTIHLYKNLLIDFFSTVGTPNFSTL